MTRIGHDEARAAAERHLRKLERGSDPLALMTGETRQTPQGWLFFYNSADYVASGNMLDALAGNGPLLVDDSGDVRELSSATPWGEQLTGA